MVRETSEITNTQHTPNLTEETSILFMKLNTQLSKMFVRKPDLWLRLKSTEQVAKQGKIDL